jgi:large subunit ribosomal protein L29
MTVKAAELREKTVPELWQELKHWREELYNLRFQAASGKLEKPSQVRKARRAIARVLTVLSQRRAQEGAHVHG